MFYLPYSPIHRHHPFTVVPFPTISSSEIGSSLSSQTTHPNHTFLNLLNPIATFSFGTLKMCYTAILKVNCKRCLAMGYGDVEHIDYKHCKEPCSRPYTITGRPSDTTPERYHCEICLPAFYEPAGDDIKKVYITRCRRPDGENSRIPDWSAASVYLVTKQYCTYLT